MGNGGPVADGERVDVMRRIGKLLPGPTENRLGFVDAAGAIGDSYESRILESQIHPHRAGGDQITSHGGCVAPQESG